MSSSPVPSSSAKTVAPLTGKRWSNLRMVLERSGPFCKADFVASPARLNFLQTECKILVIGAGGLGCELLKDLALMGFGDVHVIDMDTIELSNLNRQFLFRRHDIGSSKAEVAARFINARVPTCRVTPHFGKIQDFGDSFYSSFHVVVCGLDSIVARRWINGKLIGMLSYDEDGQIDPSTIIPLIDGGTEGFKGNVRVILPGYTACIECTLNLYPPQVTYPLCTIANTPRLPEHCIEYVKIIQWDKENPFHTPLDGDDPQHVSWIHDRALERANQFNIDGITYRLVQGVIKHIIPAVASTNAVVAAACATEVFKLATGSYECINNYMNFNDSDGIYTFTYEAEKSPQCLACSGAPQILDIARPDVYTLHDLITHLCDDKHFQMTSPSIATLKDGANRTLYMSIMGATHANLEQSLESLGLANGQHLNVSDPTSPNGVTVQLRYPDTNAAVQ